VFLIQTLRGETISILIFLIFGFGYCWLTLVLISGDLHRSFSVNFTQRILGLLHIGCSLVLSFASLEREGLLMSWFRKEGSWERRDSLLVLLWESPLSLDCSCSLFFFDQYRKKLIQSGVAVFIESAVFLREF